MTQKQFECVLVCKNIPILGFRSNEYEFINYQTKNMKTKPNPRIRLRTASTEIRRFVKASVSWRFEEEIETIIRLIWMIFTKVETIFVLFSTAISRNM